MRTTIDLADELLRKARRKAGDEGIPLRQVIETALRLYLAGPVKSGSYRLQWRADSGRLRPGVSLDDRDSLFDAMDGRK